MFTRCCLTQKKETTGCLRDGRGGNNLISKIKLSRMIPTGRTEASRRGAPAVPQVAQRRPPVGTDGITTPASAGTSSWPPKAALTPQASSSQLSVFSADFYMKSSAHAEKDVNPRGEA